MNTFCSYYNHGICQSCDRITVSYNDQVLLKERELASSLSELPTGVLLPTITSSGQGFRTKAKFIVTGSTEAPIIGLAGEGNLDHGRELLECPLHHPVINECLPVIKKFITLSKLNPYNISQKSGELKGVILFHSEQTHETYLRFVMRSKEPITRIIKYHASLLAGIPHLKSISVNIQPVPHALLEGEDEVFITERNYLNHSLQNVMMKLSPRAFVQTNQVVAKMLYETAASWVKELKTQKFLELFCGQGAFSFFCAPYITSGLGVEINENAVLLASQTAKEFKLNHLNFKNADAAQVQNKIQEFTPDLILVNPPRRGLTGVVELLLQAEPQHIIYSSCSYETLAQDLLRLSQKYQIEKIQIFDMFPQTKHFETLVLLRTIK